MPNEKLLSCPFCNATPTKSSGVAMYIIEHAITCFIVAKRFLINDREIKQWNTRTPSSELVELRRDKERLLKLAEMVWETRWVSEEEDYQHLVGVAAEIRSGSYAAIDAAKGKK